MGDQTDLLECCRLRQLAVDALSSVDSQTTHWWHLTSLAETLLEKARSAEAASHDIDFAIKVARNALELAPSPYRRSGAFVDTNYSLLACLLRLRFIAASSVKDLDESILLATRAIELRPFSKDNPGSFQTLAELAMTFWLRFEARGMECDLNQAMDILHRISDLLLDQGKLSNRLNKLAFGDKLPSFARLNRFTVTRKFMAFVHGRQTVRQLLKPSHRTIFLMFCSNITAVIPRLAYAGLDIGLRLDVLKYGTGVACDAALYALSFSEASRALETLECGRNVFWTQGLLLRASFDTIPNGLSTKLREACRQLSASSASPRLPAPSVSSHLSRAVMAERETQRLRKVAERLQLLIQEVRRLPGQEHFLRPLSPNQLPLAARDGPVVVFVAGIPGCYAIIIRPAAQPTHIAFLDMTVDRLRNLVIKCQGQQARTGRSDTRHLKGSRRRLPDGDVLLHVLHILWITVVKTVVSALNLPVRSIVFVPRLF